MFELKTEKGVLKYRLPNIIEIYDLIEDSGILKGVHAFTLKRNMVASIGKFIDFSDIEGVNSYEDLLSDVDCMIFPLGEIADVYIEKIVSVLKKKSS